MKDRTTIIDLTLTFAATFVITLAVWPKTQPRQLVRCNLDESGWQTFGVPINDPGLSELRRSVARITTPEYDPTYVTAKWQKEVAEFYERSQPLETAAEPELDERASQAETATLSDEVAIASFNLDQNSGVQTVSYVDLANAPPADVSVDGTRTEIETDQVSTLDERDEDGQVALAVSPSDGNYWTNVKATAIESMKQAETRASTVPIVMGSVVNYGWPQLAFHFAFLFGLAAACAYMHWLKRTPSDTAIALLDQRKTVIARVASFAVLIAVAMCSAVSVWS